MADPKNGLPGLGASSGWTNNAGSGSGSFGAPVIGDYGSSKYDSAKTYIDPTALDFESVTPNQGYQNKLSQMEGFRDAEQPWYDKLGNGTVKFAGTFADGLLSVPGTIWGLGLAATGHGLDSIWNNAIMDAGHSISEAASENFRNYRSTQEQKASPWSPDYWMTWNFLSDNIIGNAGYMAAAYVTGAGMSKLLSRMAPWIASRNVKTALDIVKTEGVEGLKNFERLAKSLNRWDKFQQGASLAMAASSEAGTEAMGAYKEYIQTNKQALIQKYGSESYIPDSELKKLDEEAKSVGNTIYGLNLPILMFSDAVQFGKSLMGFKSEFKAAAAAGKRTGIKLGETLGEQFTAPAVKSGFSNAVWRGLKGVGSGALHNLAESAEESAQFLVGNTTKNYYGRKYDPTGEHATDDVWDSFTQAAHDLVNTQEGVASIIGGFATPGLMPSGWKQIKDTITGRNGNKGQVEQQLSALNSVDFKDKIKKSYEAAVRHSSLQQDLNQAIAKGDEFEARNLQHDIMKSYIQSRIEAGRADILEDEIKRMQKMSADDFKTFFGVEGDTSVDHVKMLDQYLGKAKKMQSVYSTLDRVFTPNLYNVPDDKKPAAIQQMNAYKEMAWSYMMDAEDGDNRIKKLRKEVDETFGSYISTGTLFDKKTQDEQLNDWIFEYNALLVEDGLEKHMAPDRPDRKREQYKTEALNSLKAKIRKHVEENKESLGLPEYLAKGDPEFLEEFLFNVEKELSKIPTDAVFGKPLFGVGEEGIIDVTDATTKLNDLRRLERRRMLSLQAYNNLRTVIREGKYMDAFVKNPLYDEKKHKGQERFIKKDGVEIPNPDYADEFVTNEQLLRSNHYDKFQDEQEKWRKDQKEEARKNEALGEQFIEALDKQLVLGHPGLVKDHQKEFNDAFDLYYNGTGIPENDSQESSLAEKGMTERERHLAELYNKHRQHNSAEGGPGFTGYKHLSPEELEQVGKDLSKRELRARMLNMFDVSDRAARESFNYDTYIDLKARRLAYESAVRRHNKSVTRAIRKEAENLSNAYREIHEADEAAAEQFYQDVVKESKSWSKDARDGIINAMNKVREELGLLIPVPEIEEEEATEIKEEKGEDVENIENQADLTQTNKEKEKEQEAAAAGTQTPKVAPSYDQAEPDNEKGDYSEEDSARVNEYLYKQEANSDLSEDNVYLTIRRSDLQTETRYFPIKTAATFHKGTKVIIDGRNGEIVSKDNSGIVVKWDGSIEKSNYTIAEIEQFGKDKKLSKGYPFNKYNPESGEVLTNQYDDNLHNPASPYHLAPGKRIRLVKVGKKPGTNVVSVRFDVMGKDENDWYETNIIHTMDAQEVAKYFRNESKPGTIEAVENKVASVNRYLLSHDYMEAKITGDSKSIGKLIMNDGSFDKRNEFSIGEAFGLTEINNRNGGVLLGAIATDDKKGNDVRIMMSNGKMASLNEYGDVYVPESSIDAVTATGSKAGQMVAMLPTGKTTADNKKMYIPVMLRTKSMDSMPSSLTRPDNEDENMNIGEAVLDVLLNPGKKEYAASISSLFEFVGLNYNPDKPDWKSFYTNENMSRILNSVFFISSKSNKDSSEDASKGRYKFPFAVYAQTQQLQNGKGESTSVTIDITRAAGLRNTNRKVTIYITNTDGTLNTKDVDDRINDWRENAYTLADDGNGNVVKTEKPVDKDMKYSHILDVVKQKPYRVDLIQASKSERNPHTAIIIGQDGLPTTKKYDSYFHYLDDQRILTATVQGIKSGKNNKRVYFVNRQISYKTTAPVVKHEGAVQTAVKSQAEAKKEGVDTEEQVVEIREVSEKEVTGKPETIYSQEQPAGTQPADIEPEQKAGDHAEVTRLVTFLLNNPKEAASPSQIALINNYPKLEAGIRADFEKNAKQQQSQQPASGPSAETSALAKKHIKLFPQVEELAFRGKSKKDIAKLLRIPEKDVEAIREYMGIPSSSNSGKFAAWKATVEQKMKARAEEQKRKDEEAKKNQKPTSAGTPKTPEALKKSVEERKRLSSTEIGRTRNLGEEQQKLGKYVGNYIHVSVSQMSMVAAVTEGKTTQVYGETKDEVLDKMNAMYDAEIKPASGQATPSQSSAKPIGPIEQTILENQKQIELSADGKHYIVNGEKYERVSSLLPEDFTGNSANFEHSRTAGNTVDSIVRDFFNTGSRKKPRGITQDAFDVIINALDVLEAEMKKKGERFLTNRIKLFDKEKKIAGELDILVVKPNGEFGIYDVKTSQDFSTYDIGFLSPKADESDRKMSSRAKHTNQLSAYTNLFHNQYGPQGGKVTSLSVIPFEIAYDEHGHIVRATKVENKVINYDSNVGKYVPSNTQTVVQPQAAQPQNPLTAANATIPGTSVTPKPDDQKPTGNQSVASMLAAGGVNLNTVRADANTSNESLKNELPDIGNRGKNSRGIGGKLGNFGKGKQPQALINFAAINSVYQFTIPSIDAHVTMLTAELNREAVDLLLTKYAKDKSFSFTRRELKNELMQVLRNKIEDLKVQYDIVDSVVNKSEDLEAELSQLGDQLQSYYFILRYFDMDHIKATVTEDDIDLVSTIGQDGERNYFVGFYNLVLNELFKSRIVDVYANGKERIDFEANETLNYTMRYDDGWSFKIDPRDTLGKYSRIIMSTIPEQQFEYVPGEKGEEGHHVLVNTVGPLGTTRYMNYEAVFKAIISQTTQLEDAEVFDFFETMADNPEVNTNPILMALYNKLQGIKAEYGVDAYWQAVRQLSGSSLLQHAHYLRVDITTSKAAKAKGKRLNAEIKMYNLDRQMINDEIVAVWSRNLSDLLRQGKYINHYRAEDPATRQYVDRFELNKIDIEENDTVTEVTMKDYIKHKLTKAFNITNKDEMYKAVAEVYINDLGFPLSSDRTIDGTAAVLRTWNKKRRKGRVFNRHFDKVQKFANLKEMVTTTLLEYIVDPLESSVLKNTFNPVEPLSKSTTTLNAYARALKGYFKDVVNASVNDINNNTRFIYVNHSNLSENMLRLKNRDRDYLWQLANTSYGRYMPGLSDVFEKDENGNFKGIEYVNLEALSHFEQIDMDYVNGVQRDGFIKQEAKNAKAGSWDIMSLFLFQGDEDVDKKDRGIGNYIVTYGDATVVPYFKGRKQFFGAHLQMNKSTGLYHVKLNDFVGDKRVSEIREQMFNVFKSEVNRSVRAIEAFENTENHNKDANLQPDYHYVKTKGSTTPNYEIGAAAGIYNFGEKVFNDMAGAESPIFTVGINGRITGVNEKLLDENKQIKEEYLQTVFDSFADQFVSDMLNSKMEQLKPFIKEFLDLELTPTDTDELGTILEVKSIKWPMFVNSYVQSFIKRMANDKKLTINGESFIEIYNKNKGKGAFYTEEQAYRDSYAAHLFAAMILDHQLNHFIMRSTLSAMNGMDPALYQKSGKTDYKSFYDNWDKRGKGLVTPKIKTAVSRTDVVRIINYVDPSPKDVKTTYTANDMKSWQPHQVKMVKFLQKIVNTPAAELAKFDEDYQSTIAQLKGIFVFNPDGSVTMPRRVLNHQVEAHFGLHEKKWDNASHQSVNDFLKSYVLHYLTMKSTDGFSVITLQEYLYRKYLEGAIKNEAEFLELWNFYHQPSLNPNDPEFKKKMPLLGLKYVMTGTKIENNEMFRIYGKDGEVVLLPSDVKGTHWEDVLNELEEHETNGDPRTISPGICLKPLSAMKQGAFAPIQLFNTNGQYVKGTIKNANLSQWSRSVSGKQIQNPDKTANRSTLGTQNEKFMFNDVPSGTIVGEDIFETDFGSYDEKAKKAIAAGKNKLALMYIYKASQLKKRKEKEREESEDIDEVEDKEYEDRQIMNGRFANHLMGDRYKVKSELMRRDLAELMGRWGLRFEVGGRQYTDLIKQLGLDESATIDDLGKLMGSTDSNTARLAYLAYKLRQQIVTTNIDKMLNDIKDQLLQRKGFTINNTYVLKKAAANLLDMPITFAPNSAQIQSVILAQINKIIQGRKISGIGLMQMPATGFEQKATGNSELKGYTAKYDKSGKFVGLESAEIVLPWRFTDPISGELLDFNKYCNPDGTPKKEMWDSEVLKVIGSRIPGTGPNTLGHFKVVRFTRGVRDVVQIPEEVMAQMNSDYDFDKLYTYLYHYNIDPTSGKVSKVKGFLHSSQDGALEYAASEEGQRMAVSYMLRDMDPNYDAKLSDVKAIVNKKLYELQDEVLRDMNSEKGEDDAVVEYEDLVSMSLEKKVQIIKGHMLKTESIKLDELYGELTGLEKKAAEQMTKDGSLMEFLNRASSLQAIQSNEQLENALIDSYHIMLNNNTVARSMTKPLVTEWIENQMEVPVYNGKSIKEHRAGTLLKSPVTEVSNSDTRHSNTGADLMIGIGANGQTIIHMAQHADLAIPNDASIEPIFFADSKGAIIKEEKYNPEMFAVYDKVFDNTGRKDMMRLENAGDIRFRLGRIYTTDEKGNRVAISTAWQSILQAALDNMNNPIVGIVGINEQTSNEILAMLSLGYIDHAIPLINQESVQAYVQLAQNYKGLIRGDKKFEEALEDLVASFYIKAGMWPKETMKDQDTGQDMDKAAVIAYLNATHIKAFTAKELRDNIGKSEIEKDSKYYIDQARALAMFLRVKKVGNILFDLQVKANIESKGFQDTTLVGVHHQYTNYNQIGKLKLLNVDEIVSYKNKKFGTTLAARYGLNAFRDIFEFGKNGMFEDLGPAFTNLRKIVAFANRRGFNLDVAKHSNKEIVSFILSNPEFYTELITEVLGEEAASLPADSLRRMLLKEKYKTTVESDDRVRIDPKSNTAVTVAGLLDKLQKAKDEEGTAYTDKYEILNNLRPVVQRNNSNPSVVVYLNANNYKQRLDVLLPKSILQMLEDPNDDVKKLAKMLVLYSYLTGGTNNPISYLTSIPMELMFKNNFGERIRKEMAHLNKIIEGTMNEYFIKSNRSEKEEAEDTTEYADELGGGTLTTIYNEDELSSEDSQEITKDSRTFIAKLLSGDYITDNMEGLNVMRAFFYQYYQHHVYDLKDAFVAGSYEAIGNGFYRLDKLPAKDAPLAVVHNKDGVHVFIKLTDGVNEYVRTTGAGYSYNVNEYTYSTEGAYTDSVAYVDDSNLNQSKSEMPTDLELTSIGQSQVIAGEREIVKLPFEANRKQSEVNNFTDTVHNGLDYIREHSLYVASETPNPKKRQAQEEYAHIAEYLKRFIPADMPYGIDTDLKTNGLPSKGRADVTANGTVTKLWFNPKAGSMDSKHMDFKLVMLHEATHGALSRAMEIIKDVKKGKLSKEGGAAALLVSVDKFENMIDGYNRLEEMLNNQNFLTAFKHTYNVHELERNKTDNLSNDELAKMASAIGFAYGTSNVEEFVATVMSDRTIRRALNEMDYAGREKKQSILDRLIQLFMDILGIRRGSGLEETMYNIVLLTDSLNQVKSSLGTDPASVKAGKALFNFEHESIPFHVNAHQVANSYIFKQTQC